MLFALRACGGGSDGAGGTYPQQSAPTPSPTPAPAATPTPAPTATPTPVATPVPGTGVIVQAGDSIGYGGEAGGYAAIDHLDLPGSVAIHNVSVSGRTMVTGFERRGVELFGFYQPDVPCVLLIQQGTNDIDVDGRSGSSLYYDVAMPFIRAARSAGFYVGLSTLLPRADPRWSAAKEAQRTAYNLLVRGNGANADAVNDLAADPQIGDIANPAGSPFYVDGLHPSLAGQQRLSSLDRVFVSGLLEKPPRARL